MQMRKTHWKMLRRERPCRICAEDHETGVCATRHGKRKSKKEDWKR